MDIYLTWNKLKKLIKLIIIHVKMKAYKIKV